MAANRHSPAFRDANPQQLVPVLEHGQRMLRQSLAILEYLDEIWPEPALLPATARERQRVRALAQLVACDIHPLNNLRVLQYFEREWAPQPGARRLGAALDRRRVRRIRVDAGRTSVHRHVLRRQQPEHRRLLPAVPQLYNARRFGVALDADPTMLRIERACMELPAFQAAQPERQPDAPAPEPLPRQCADEACWELVSNTSA